LYPNDELLDHDDLLLSCLDKHQVFGRHVGRSVDAGGQYGVDPDNDCLPPNTRVRRRDPRDGHGGVRQHAPTIEDDARRGQTAKDGGQVG